MLLFEFDDAKLFSIRCLLFGGSDCHWWKYTDSGFYSEECMVSENPKQQIGDCKSFKPNSQPDAGEPNEGFNPLKENPEQPGRGHGRKKQAHAQKARHRFAKNALSRSRNVNAISPRNQTLDFNCPGQMSRSK